MQEHPTLLNKLFALLCDSPSAELRQETTITLGILGALDPCVVFVASNY
jgi:hypothetical protein